MRKTAKPLSFSVPFVRIMVRKRAKVWKLETHPGKVGRVFNVGLYMVAAFPKKHVRTPKDDMHVS